MVNLIKKKIDFLTSALTFFGSMAVYIFTLAPSIVMEDSAEFITAAYKLGIAHPSGYPLYTILGHLFTFIPFGSIAWRVNLMSAFFAALTAALFYLILQHLLKNRIIALASAFLLAFSPVFWSQSVFAEVYTLNSFFVVLLILILLYWQRHKNNQYLYWFSFLFGLSLTNHTMNVLIAPAFALFIVINDKDFWFNWRLITKMVLFFGIGLLVYLYIPLRAFQQPDFNWGPIGNWHDVIAHLTRAQYNDFNPFTSSFSKTGIALSFLYSIYQQFFLPTLFLSAGGAVYLWRKHRSVAVLTIGIFLFNSLGIIYLRKFGWGLGVDYVYRVYYLPAFIMIVFWLAVSLSYLINFLKEFFKNYSGFVKKLVSVFLYLTILSLPVSFLLANYEANDLSDFWSNYDFTRNLLESLEPNSVYYYAYDGGLNGDTELFSLVYLKMVENVRPDVSVVSEHNFFYKDFILRLPPEHFGLSFEAKKRQLLNLLKEVSVDRTIYTNYVVFDKNNDQGFFSISNGYAHKIYPSFESATQAVPPDHFSSIRGLDEIDEFSPFSELEFAKHYYYNLASFYLARGNSDQSQDHLIKALQFEYLPGGHEYRDFIEYRNQYLRLKPM